MPTAPKYLEDNNCTFNTMLLKIRRVGHTLQECNEAFSFPKANGMSTFLLEKKISSKTQSTFFEGLGCHCVKPPHNKAVPAHNELVSNSPWIPPLEKKKNSVIPSDHPLLLFLASIGLLHFSCYSFIIICIFPLLHFL